MSGSWHFLILELAWPFETRLLLKKNIKKKCFSYFPHYECELFWRYYDRLYAFVTRCGYCLVKQEILNAVYEGVNCETRALLEYCIFVLKMLMKHTISLIRWLVTLMNLKLAVLVPTSHPHCISDYTPLMCKI